MGQTKKRNYDRYTLPFKLQAVKLADMPSVTAMEVAVGLVIGSLVNIFVTGRLQSYKAALTAGLIYFTVLAFCVWLCYQIDLSIGLFGAHESPRLFVLGGLVPAMLTSVVYAWILYSQTGRALLDRAGL